MSGSRFGNGQFVFAPVFNIQTVLNKDETDELAKRVVAALLAEIEGKSSEKGVGGVPPAIASSPSDAQDTPVTSKPVTGGTGEKGGDVDG